MGRGYFNIRSMKDRDRLPKSYKLFVNPEKISNPPDMEENLIIR
jgi:hypothetical protein